MPLYEYRCTNCGKSCEMLQKMNDAAAVTCAHCGKDQLQRQVSAPRFQLKGTGWYVTDFKNKNQNASAEPTKDTPTDAPAKSEESSSTPETPKTTSEKKQDS